MVILVELLHLLLRQVSTLILPLKRGATDNFN